jgi:aryl-alcohol dehydrogenase-like predicted oxidoreductase
MPEALDHVPASPRPSDAAEWQTPLLGLGGEGMLSQPFNDRLAYGIIERALELGVWYIDTAPSYGHGASESRIGHVIEGRRDELFLATKTRARTRDRAWRKLERSLKRLRTDRIDLWQLQDVRSQRDIRRIFDPNGALKALLEAREQGVVQHVGVSGRHDAAVLLDAINGFGFDSVLLPLDASAMHRRPLTRCVLHRAVARGAAVIAQYVPPPVCTSRGDGAPSMAGTLRWALSHPVSTVVMACDTVDQLEAAAAVTRGFVPMSQLERRAFAARTAHYSTVPTFFKWQGNGRPDAPRRWGTRLAPWRVVQEAGT